MRHSTLTENCENEGRRPKHPLAQGGPFAQVMIELRIRENKCIGHKIRRLSPPRSTESKRGASPPVPPTRAS